MLLPPASRQGRSSCLHPTLKLRGMEADLPAEPEKGKKVKQKAFNRIMEDKIREWQETQKTDNGGGKKEK